MLEVVTLSHGVVNIKTRLKDNLLLQWKRISCKHLAALNPVKIIIVVEKRNNLYLGLVSPSSG